MPVLLQLTACNHTMDMSVGNLLRRTREIPLEELRPGMKIGVDEMPQNGTTEIRSADPGRISLAWGGRTFEVPFGGEPVATHCLQLENPYLSVDEIYMEYRFLLRTPEDKIRELLGEIAEYHDRFDSPAYPATAARQEQVLELVRERIDAGEYSYYPLYALLKSCDNWSRGTLVRPALFRRILLEGIDRGCLAPDNRQAWVWMGAAAVNNDPAVFLEDRKRYDALLAEAAACGDENARSIRERLGQR